MNFAPFAALLQTEMEAALAGVLNFGTQDIPCARGPWRNIPAFDNAMGTQAEHRTCAVRVTKAALNDAGITLIIGQTNGTLDGVKVVVTDQSAGPNDPAFRLTLTASMPDEAQE